MFTVLFLSSRLFSMYCSMWSHMHGMFCAKVVCEKWILVLSTSLVCWVRIMSIKLRNGVNHQIGGESWVTGHHMKEPCSVHKKRGWGVKEYKVSPQRKSCTQHIYCLSLKLWSLVMEAMISKHSNPFRWKSEIKTWKKLHMFGHWEKEEKKTECQFGSAIDWLSIL